MSGNTFGRIFRLTSYGESHGPGLGGIIDGCPAGVPIDEAAIQAELDSRRPGQENNPAGSARQEADKANLLSGISYGYSTGAPIAFYIRNTDARPEDYDILRDIYRPGHADFTYRAKYGKNDFSGGGRSSGRETVSRVAGGAIAQAFLNTIGISVRAYTLELGGLPAQIESPYQAHNRPFFAPSEDAVSLWQNLVDQTKADGDSLGGIVRLEAFGLPPGLGEPVFDKLDARLAYALMSVGTVKGVEFGSGFAAAKSRGSLHNDPLLPGPTPEVPQFASNNAGGVLGGISTGQPLSINVAVKPISSISKTQNSVNYSGAPVILAIEGRHDISTIPRIVPVLKAMLAITLADFALLLRSSKA